MQENGFERGLAEELMKELMKTQNGSNASWSIVERHDGVYVQKERADGDIVLYEVLPNDNIAEQ